MENWWFFRDTKDAKIYEQRKIAEQLVPDRRHCLVANLKQYQDLDLLET